jgi:hypothetical protein
MWWSSLGRKVCLRAAGSAGSPVRFARPFLHRGSGWLHPSSQGKLNPIPSHFSPGCCPHPQGHEFSRIRKKAYLSRAMIAALDSRPLWVLSHASSCALARSAASTWPRSTTASTGAGTCASLCACVCFAVSSMRVKVVKRCQRVDLRCQLIVNAAVGLPPARISVLEFITSQPTQP